MARIKNNSKKSVEIHETPVETFDSVFHDAHLHYINVKKQKVTLKEIGEALVEELNKRSLINSYRFGKEGNSYVITNDIILDFKVKCSDYRKLYIASLDIAVEEIDKKFLDSLCATKDGIPVARLNLTKEILEKYLDTSATNKETFKGNEDIYYYDTACNRYVLVYSLVFSHYENSPAIAILKKKFEEAGFDKKSLSNILKKKAQAAEIAALSFPMGSILPMPIDFAIRKDGKMTEEFDKLKIGGFDDFLAIVSETKTLSFTHYTDIIKKLGEQFGSFYILPSSTHEILILKGDYDKEIANHLKMLISDVNHRLDPDIILDSVPLWYNAKTKRYKVCK